MICKTCSTLRQYHHLSTHLIVFGLKFNKKKLCCVDTSNKQLQPLFVYWNYQVTSITRMGGIMIVPVRKKRTIIGILKRVKIDLKLSIAQSRFIYCICGIYFVEYNKVFQHPISIIFYMWRKKAIPVSKYVVH